MQGLRSNPWRFDLGLCAAALILATTQLAAQVPAASEPAATHDAATNAADGVEAKRPLSKDPPGMKRLMPEYDVWIDPKNKRVVMDGTVVLREGQLEMFACPRGTKEHESIVAVDTKAYAVHAGLLAVGAEVGTPVQFQPEYKPATGTEIDIELVYRDAAGTVHRDRAQDWIRNVQTGQAMALPWVFAGSGFWVDEADGKKHYMAEQGDFICVSNFPSAMLDLPVESSQDNAQLLHEAFTEKIPPLGTRVRLVLTPKAKD
ncbi:MAG: YdjY domain-containing protein [Pirellulales bacterium]